MKSPSWWEGCLYQLSSSQRTDSQEAERRRRLPLTLPAPATVPWTAAGARSTGALLVGAATTPSCGIPGLTTSTATAATTTTLGGLIVIAPGIATGADTAIASGVTSVGTRTVGAVLSTGATAIVAA